ncbi:alpha/beta-hydrolase [Canariomyces notabilis]|uniref:Carboxylic ester hydrolase n=1 Tax=Canariomyces notabilis TaxID=2074819 RepID=A0AAN6QL21_9PEZI|nr:alpha/beta-hydrolase [Canariomyces arenarius]
MTDFESAKSSLSAPVETESGLVSGLVLANKTRAFLGVPYAAPPVGPLRWRPPQPAVPWTGVRSATSLPPAAFQFAPPPNSIYYGGETSFSEDCLYLNIYTGPEEDSTKNTALRPVLVWFHFGAFQFGSVSNPIYSGEHLASSAGLTVVTVNHRLGRLGFLAHPELTAESPHGTSGNYGIQDQVAALAWVSRNVARFGGDPANVTIGGASAGGCSVHILRASPLARGLFSKAVVESGPGVAPLLPGDDAHGHVAAFTGLAAAEKAGLELQSHLGAKSIDEMRALHPAAIAGVHLPRSEGIWRAALWPAARTSLSLFDTANPIVDGYVLPESPLAALLKGRAADVPLLAGNVGNEASGMPFLASVEDFETYVRETFKDQAEDALRLYPAEADDEGEGVRWASSQLLADHVFTWSTWTAARVQSQKFKSPAWYFRFERAPPIPQEADLVENRKSRARAFHCAVVPYAFGTLDAFKWNWTDADRELSQSISDALARFVRSGRPGDEREDEDNFWPALGSEGSLIKVWNAGSSRLEAPGLRLASLTAFWDRYYGVQGQIDV